MNKKRRNGIFKSIIDLISIVVFDDIALKIVEKLNLDKKAIGGNLKSHPVNLIAKYLFYAMITGLYSFFIWTSIYPIIPKTYTFTGIIITFITIFAIASYPIVKIINAIDENKIRISQEIPFFLFHISVLARTNTPLEDLLNKLSSSKIYPTISSYIKRIMSISKTLGWDLLHAIEEVGSSIPHKALSNILSGFANTLRTKSKTTDFLDRAMMTVLEDQRVYHNRLKYSVSTLAMIYSVLMMSILFLNLLQITSATGKLALPINVYALISIVAIPLLSFMILWLLYIKIPKLDQPSRQPLIAFIILLPFSSLIGYALHEFINRVTIFSGEIALCITLAVSSFFASRIYKIIYTDDKELISNFTNFLHDIASERRLGIPLEQIITNMNYVYGPLNRPLKILKMGIKTGVPMETAIAMAFSGIRSKIIRFMAILLGDAIVLGSATEETFGFMERMVKEFIDVINSMRNELRSISITPYIIIIVEVVSLVFYININPSSIVGYTLSEQQQLSTEYNTNLETVTHYFAYGVIETSFIGAFIVGLLRRQNPWAGFFHASIILLIISLLFSFEKYLGCIINI